MRRQHHQSHHWGRPVCRVGPSSKGFELVLIGGGLVGSKLRGLLGAQVLGRSKFAGQPGKLADARECCERVALVDAEEEERESTMDSQWQILVQKALAPVTSNWARVEESLNSILRLLYQIHIDDARLYTRYAAHPPAFPLVATPAPDALWHPRRTIPSISLIFAISRAFYALFCSPTTQHEATVQPAGSVRPPTKTQNEPASIRGPSSLRF
ncbi:hypothetical protein CPB86DRAFT_299428 [Serendipita vermifera]|nr:hypothetical protein CPB86DRAFT_299428 [Serendipita vermifera]